MDKMPGQAMQLGETTYPVNSATSVQELVENIGWNYGVLWAQRGDCDELSRRELQYIECYCNMLTFRANSSELLDGNSPSIFTGCALSRSLAEETLRTRRTPDPFVAANRVYPDGNFQTLLFMANANSDHVLELGSAREVSGQALASARKEGEGFLQLITDLDFADSLISENPASSDLDSVGNSCYSISESAASMTPTSTRPLKSPPCANGIQQTFQSITAENFSSDQILFAEPTVPDVPHRTKRRQKLIHMHPESQLPESPTSVGTTHECPARRQESLQAKPTVHAQAERKRRANSNIQLDALRKIVCTPGKKKDKASVLDYAVKMIQEDVAAIDDLKNGIKELEERIRLNRTILELGFMS